MRALHLVMREPRAADHAVTPVGWTYISLSNYTQLCPGRRKLRDVLGRPYDILLPRHVVASDHEVMCNTGYDGLGLVVCGSPGVFVCRAACDPVDVWLLGLFPGEGGVV